MQALGGTHLLKLKLFTQKLRIVFSEEQRGRGGGGGGTSEYLLTFGPINKTMVAGICKESSLPVCQHTSVNYLCKLGPKQ